MTASETISLFSGIGTFLAAIATFLTVREIIKQRKSSYRPELVLSKIVFCASADMRRGRNLPALWTNDHKVTENSREIEIPLSNIGMGAAKSVVVKWDFPITEALSLVENIHSDANDEASFTFKSDILTIKSKLLGSFSSMWGNQKTQMLDYVLPASIQTEPTTIKIPHAYMALVSSLMYLAAQKDLLELPAIAPLTATFEYRDIADERRKAAYNIEFGLIALFGDGFHAYLEPKRQKNI